MKVIDARARRNKIVFMSCHLFFDSSYVHCLGMCVMVQGVTVALNCGATTIV
jgi:hypothetical protein